MFIKIMMVLIIDDYVGHHRHHHHHPLPQSEEMATDNLMAINKTVGVPLYINIVIMIIVVMTVTIINKTVCSIFH